MNRISLNNDDDDDDDVQFRRSMMTIYEIYSIE